MPDEAPVTSAMDPLIVHAYAFKLLWRNMMFIISVVDMNAARVQETSAVAAGQVFERRIAQRVGKPGVVDGACQ
jgi:hypothetical protein